MKTYNVQLIRNSNYEQLQVDIDDFFNKNAQYVDILGALTMSF
jgi:hypothetical protein